MTFISLRFCAQMLLSSKSSEDRVKASITGCYLHGNLGGTSSIVLNTDGNPVYGPFESRKQN